MGLRTNIEENGKALDTKMVIHGMDIAMKEAKKAFHDETYPIGAAILSPEGKVIGQGRNHIYSRGDYTSHAEIEAIRNAGGRLMKKRNLNYCTLYTTMEPCLMCSGAILLSHIHRVVWLIGNTHHGALTQLKKEEISLSAFYKDRLSPLIMEGIDQSDEVKMVIEPWKQDMEAWMKEWNQKKDRIPAEQLLYKRNFLQRFLPPMWAKMSLRQRFI